MALAPVPMPGQSAVSGRRRMRRPVHTFQLRFRPFIIQPFMIAPVLAGETLKNALFQVRAVTDPINNPIVGWHLEMHMFYVKLTDLEQSYADDFKRMLITPGHNISALINTSTAQQWYSADGGLPFTALCLYRVTDTYFRAGDEDRTTAAGLYSTQPMAHVIRPGWMDSLVPTASLTNSEDVEIADISAQTTLLGSDDKIHASEIESALRTWQLLSFNGLTTQTWEEYLATYGVAPPPEAAHRPELIRSVRSWQYPSNTIDPTNGTPRSAVSWSIAERADKDRRFAEPGFIFGVVIVRPKVYFRNQIGAAAEFLKDAYRWAPAVLFNDPKSQFASESDTADSPLDPAVMTAPFTWDARDLFNRGDQFLNFAPSVVNANIVGLPSADATNVRYVGTEDISDLFVTEDTAEFVKLDGICNLTIATHLPLDYSPQDVGGSSTIVV